MSAINDFNKVWEQKFPGSQLPPAWEEDVKYNLATHKKRVQELQNELKKEEDYVQFLEKLLEEVEKRKESNIGDEKGKRGSNVENHEKDIADVIKNTVERRFHFAGEIGKESAGNEKVERSLDSRNENNGEPTQEDKSMQSLDSVGISDDFRSIKVSDESLSTDLRETEDDISGAEDNGDESKSKDHFVTVIEVNGFEKEKAAALAQSKTNGNGSELKRQRKVPPRPPPKVFKRPEVSTSAFLVGRQAYQSGAVSTDDRKSMFEKDNSKSTADSSTDSKQNRPVVFDSRSSNNVPKNGNNNDSSSGNSTASSTSSSKECATTTNNLNIFPRSQAAKKFEGSKMPLPQQPSSNQHEDKDANKNPRKQTTKGSSLSPKPSQRSSNSNSNEKATHNVRSKVFDLVSKMETTRAPPLPAKGNSDPLTPKQSFRKKVADPLYCTAHDAVLDYIDPLDVEYDGVTDQIYDCPPAESPEHVNDSPETRHQGSKTSTMESQESARSGADVVDTDIEPMYDTVAPDQDDDYVVLLEEENQQQNQTSANNSLSKIEGSQRRRESDYANTPLNTDAAATIKSQASVISGQSITTTTSSGTTSDTEGITGSPLPQDAHGEARKTASNYVNIDYFLG